MGKSRRKQPGDKGNVQISRAAVIVIPRGLVFTCGRFLCRCRSIRYERSRGEWFEYRLYGLCLGSIYKQCTHLHPIAFRPISGVRIWGEIANDAVFASKFDIKRDFCRILCLCRPICKKPIRPIFFSLLTCDKQKPVERVNLSHRWCDNSLNQNDVSVFWCVRYYNSRILLPVVSIK